MEALAWSGRGDGVNSVSTLSQACDGDAIEAYRGVATRPCVGVDAQVAIGHQDAVADRRGTPVDRDRRRRSGPARAFDGAPVAAADAGPGVDARVADRAAVLVDRNCAG